ncbi:hypothetical protein E2C01_092785 [Portunus trituberculatus]|uniref:Uncharacterized protein n=1 Tax=Portunus trituberculatus TaxID=210409 RepID=A0A5B7JWU2_PORTR|nr:hypothetical protein [Portunus trituberculatus]
MKVSSSCYEGDFAARGKPSQASCRVTGSLGTHRKTEMGGQSFNGTWGKCPGVCVWQGEWLVKRSIDPLSQGVAVQQTLSWNTKKTWPDATRRSACLPLVRDTGGRFIKRVTNS